jgi:hypothetical protein
MREKEEEVEKDWDRNRTKVLGNPKGDTCAAYLLTSHISSSQ